MLTSTHSIVIHLYHRIDRCNIYVCHINKLESIKLKKQRVKKLCKGSFILRERQADGEEQQRFQSTFTQLISEN